jgi:hypothetical protein
MVQFYFLSIVMNLLAGYMLFSGDADGILEFKSGFSFRDETVRLIAGIVSVLVGLMKILSVIEGDVPVIGDLIPALTGFLSGFILIYEYYKNRSSLGVSEKTEKIERILVGNRKIIGAASLVAAALHFIFPGVLLL